MDGWMDDRSYSQMTSDVLVGRTPVRWNFLDYMNEIVPPLICMYLVFYERFDNVLAPAYRR